jgi:hypothetical protein
LTRRRRCTSGRCKALKNASDTNTSDVVGFAVHLLDLEDHNLADGFYILLQEDFVDVY